MVLINGLLKIRAREGTSVRIPVERILAEHDVVYSRDTAADEDIIEDLDEYPMQNSRGEDVPIFDAEGNSIKRSTARPLPGSKSAAVFLALNKVKSLFRDHSISLNTEGFVHNPNIDKYPIGHLANVGCIQTRQPFPPFSPVVNKINKDVGRVIAYDAGDEPLYDDVDEDGNLVEPAGRVMHPIFGTHTQVYNLSTHHFAPRANEYRVLHGQVTAAASSVFATRLGERSKGKQAVQKLSVHLPFEALEAQIDGASVPTSMRLEQVFVVCFDDLDESYKSGRCVIAV